FGQVDEVVHAAGALHRGDRGDDAHDDADDVEGDVRGRDRHTGETEEEHAETTGEADGDGTQAGAEDDGTQDDEYLEGEQHNHKPMVRPQAKPSFSTQKVPVCV